MNLRERLRKEYFEPNLQAAELGFTEAMSEVAKLYLTGQGVEKNSDAAIEWFEKAIDNGDISAAVVLGRIYAEDDFRFSKPVAYSTIKLQDVAGLKNIDKAIFYLSQAAEKNNLDAIIKLAEIYEEQNDFEKMFECYQKAALLGRVDFMRKLANCYLRGRGVPQDDLKALECYIKVVENSHDGLSNNDVRLVAQIYNKHFQFNDEKFFNYYFTTKKIGYFAAMFGIAAELYETDKHRALKWYEIAEKFGDYDAAVAASHIIAYDLYFSFDTVPKYCPEAVKSYVRAAHFGNINAAKNLVIFFNDGLCGYDRNVRTSLSWLKKVLEMEAKNKNV